MSRIVEFLGHGVTQQGLDWTNIVEKRSCPYTSRACSKTRKSDSTICIGTCTVQHGEPAMPIVICPHRFIDRQQIFNDCHGYLTGHQAGHALHTVGEVRIPGGKVDYFLVSTHAGKIRDFVGIELQAVDTTGSLWPERQRLLRQLNLPRSDGAERLPGSYGMNWKMSAKTILMQLHHKVMTFEHIGKKLVLVVQDHFLDYLVGGFKMSHLREPAHAVDAMHIHAYRMEQQPDGSFNLALHARRSTDSEGIRLCLDMLADARVEIESIEAALHEKIFGTTLPLPFS